MEKIQVEFTRDNDDENIDEPCEYFLFFDVFLLFFFDVKRRWF